ncbi:hypothetical protein CEXT_498401 [Caerostris extrusa]|uniref:Uncharacterized protein n=1 Tax=Caerostris extrusa TaxID=172846 RepID=A0AAV4TJC1_CAEEX|nr:hypothetical protein CEXT_498401 [Caerostris extrusa]
MEIPKSPFGTKKLLYSLKLLEIGLSLRVIEIGPSPKGNGKWFTPSHFLRIMKISPPSKDDGPIPKDNGNS